MQRFPQLRGDLQPVHPVWQIVVRKNEVGPERPACHQFQRRDAVRRRRRAMALFLENELEEVANLGIVLDHQDRAGAASVSTIASPRPVERSARCRAALGGSMTSMAKTEPLPGWDRTRTRWPSSRPSRCTMERPRPRPRLRSRAGLSS